MLLFNTKHSFIESISCIKQQNKIKHGYLYIHCNSDTKKFWFRNILLSGMFYNKEILEIFILVIIYSSLINASNL